MKKLRCAIFIGIAIALGLGVGIATKSEAGVYYNAKWDHGVCLHIGLARE